MNCPCCDQPLPTVKGVKLVPQYCAVLAGDSVVVLTRQQFKIVQAVAKHKVTFTRIVEAVYDDPSGGPPTAQWCISGAITAMNKKLKDIGLRVCGDRGSSHVSLYGLVRL